MPRKSPRFVLCKHVNKPWAAYRMRIVDVRHIMTSDDQNWFKQVIVVLWFSKLYGCCTLSIIPWTSPSELHYTMRRVQCYQEKEEKVYPCTLLHVECPNLHDNPPNLEFCFSRTFYTFDFDDGVFHAFLPQIFAQKHKNVQKHFSLGFSLNFSVKNPQLRQRMTDKVSYHRIKYA